VAARNQSSQAREARERRRLHAARRALHERRQGRRRRDDRLALIALVVVAALATGSQLLYAGRAHPGSSPSASASATAAPSTSPSPSATGHDTGHVPSATIAADSTWKGTLTLNKDVTLDIQLDGHAAPQSTSVLVDLIRKRFYEGTTCHRLSVAPSARFIQCGSANGDGTGDAGFQYGPVENAPANGDYPTGTIAMARSTSEYSQTTQFFITYGDTHLDGSTGGYTVVGKVTGGLDQLERRIAAKGVATAGSDGTGTPTVRTTITGATIAIAK
jgi:peptidyl-prolyl cis-trans isomerase B (cyclophilin B)